MDIKKLSLLTDFYELTMANAYFNDHRESEIAVFDVFFRRVPDNGGFAIFAGLESVIEYLSHLKFSPSDIKYLKSKKIFSKGFLDYLANFKFSSDLYAMKEGTPIFPNEPILVVRGPLIECQLIETMILLCFNHQSLIATKAHRICQAANGRAVLEFGARRAHSFDASIIGARSAYIGGVVGTSNTIADKLYQIPALGTMAHSYVQSFDTEYQAFESYARNYPENTVLLVDTYNTLLQGIPNAIRVHEEILKPMGQSLKGIRIDSGDLAYLSKQARMMLDEAGLFDVKITVSNSLDEKLINDLIVNQGAKIDLFGVGERLITSRSEAVFGGVYKMSALEVNGTLIPKIKVSDNPSKTTIPGFKQVYRFFDQNDMAIADVITLFDEVIDPLQPYKLFDPVYTYKEKIVANFKAVPLLIPIFKNGQLVYQVPSLKEVRIHKEASVNQLWNELKRLEFPHQYYVDLSKPLWDLVQNLVLKHRDS